MAIFEQTSQTKALIDDTEILSCTVENTQTVKKHTEYILRVRRGILKESNWTVSHRYQHFVELDNELVQAGYKLNLPPKKYFGNLQPSFIAERQLALQEYINEVLKHGILSLSLQVRRFLDPNNYPFNAAEQALQTVSIALRGEGRFELKSALPAIGWRVRKHYFLVTDTKTQTECMLSWQSYGADRYLNDKDLQTTFKSLLNLSHPHIEPMLALHSLETGAYAVRAILEKGSVRDMIYNKEYNKSYISKYANPKNMPFTEDMISYYGYQILQALKFLHEKGIAHGNVHPGNIAIVQQRAVLLDVETTWLGGPHLFRQDILQLRHNHSAETIDVYCFGRTVYEMAFGRPLNNYYCEYIPEFIGNDLKSLLRRCLSRESCRDGGSSVQDVLQLALFRRAQAGERGVRGTLKFPLALKEQIKAAISLGEDKLRMEQKKRRSAKRELRIQEILGSEEEMKKHKRKEKQREGEWRSMSSIVEMCNSPTTSSGSTPTPPTMASVCTAAPDSPPSYEARTSLLAAICAFDKSSLATATPSHS